MSQTSSPARPPEPEGKAQPSAASVLTGQDSTAQIWKLVALALALLLLAVLLYFLSAGPASEQPAAVPGEGEYAEQEEYAEEEPAKEPPAPAPAPAPPPAAEAPRSYARPPSRGMDAPQPPTLPSVRVVSVGYSATPALRIVAIRIGGGLPTFVREGDTVGDLKVVAIFADRVRLSRGGKTYEIPVGN